MEIFVTTPTTSAVPDFTSGAVDLGDVINCSFFALLSGSDVGGTFKLQGGNDGTNFVDISGATSTITSSSDALISISDAGYRYVRYDWNYSSGTGNITVTFCGKGRLPTTRNKTGK